MRIRQRKKNIILAFVVGVLIAAASVAAALYFWPTAQKQPATDQPEVISEANAETEDQGVVITTKRVLTASTDIKAGELVTMADLRFRDVEADLLPEAPVESELDIAGQRAAVDISNYRVVTKEMLIPKAAWHRPEDRLVEINFVDGAIPSIIPQDKLVGTYVDIMLFRTDAPDECVVSKTAIVAANENKLGFHLLEQEIENLKEAQIEPDGLYLAAYLNDDQKPSAVTYKPGYERLVSP